MSSSRSTPTNLCPRFAPSAECRCDILPSISLELNGQQGSTARIADPPRGAAAGRTYAAARHVLAGGRMRRTRLPDAARHKPARFSRWRRSSACRIRTTGSWASQICAAACMESSTSRVSSAWALASATSLASRLDWWYSTRTFELNCALLVDRLAGLRSAEQLSLDAGAGTRSAAVRRRALSRQRWTSSGKS